MIGRDYSDGNNVIRAGDDGPGGHRDHWVEIASGQGVAQIAQIVSKDAWTSAKSARSAVSSR